MHSRFWTFCAAANIFLFLMTLSVIYFNKDKARRLDTSLFHRDVAGWYGGNKVWREYYETNYNASFNFLPSGLDAVGCDSPGRAPICRCLARAYNRPCKDSQWEGVRNCFMNTKPVVKIVELDNNLNPYALLDSLNVWGMMGSVVLWIRMYVCKEDESMPYSIQFVLGLFAAIIHCSVLEPQISAYLTYIALAGLLSFLSYSHRLDKNWWLSMYMLQYAFTVPNFALLTFVATQKRDMLFVIVGFMLAIVYGLTAMGRALLDDAKDESNEARGSYNVVRAALVFLLLGLTLSAYDDGGHFFMRSSHTSGNAHGFTIVLIAFMFLGLLCPDNLKRVCFSDFAIRFLVSMLMVTELVMAPTL